MTTNPVSGASAPSSAPRSTTLQKTGLAALDQGDFLTLMTRQLTIQDPFDPVDQKEMLAQMAQFSSLAGTTEMAATLKDIAAKLDAVLAAQTAANSSTAA